MNNLSLYKIADQYLEASTALADLDIDAQTLADTLEGLSGELEVKAQNVAMFVRNLEASAEAIKAAEKQMTERRKAIENRAESIRDYLKSNMERTGINKIECPWFTIAIKKNPKSVCIDDANVIPNEYKRQPEPPPPSPDKKAIKDAIEAGKDVPGAHIEQGTRLEIK